MRFCGEKRRDRLPGRPGRCATGGFIAGGSPAASHAHDTPLCREANAFRSDCLPAQVQTRLLLHTRALNVSKAAAIRARSAAAAAASAGAVGRRQCSTWQPRSRRAEASATTCIHAQSCSWWRCAWNSNTHESPAVSRAAHATHSHEYGGVIQLIVMSQAACFNSTRLTLIMKRVVPWYMSPLTVICCAFSMRRPASSYCRLSDGRIASVSPSRVAVRSSAWDERAQPKAEGRERREGALRSKQGPIGRPAGLGAPISGQLAEGRPETAGRGRSPTLS